MAKKLIVLSDGTGNSAAKLFRTNVWKLYEALDLSPSSDQIALYDDGVGTSRFKPWALLTGAFGFGLKRNVLRTYVFLSRHYSNALHAQKLASPDIPPVPPDIYAFGFSRGAFTMRVLAGLVIRQGLLPLDTEAEMCRKAVLSYREYRKKRFHTKFRIEKPFRDMRDAFVSLKDRLFGRAPYTSAQNIQNVQIRFLGVWDTVAAYGLPIEELRTAVDKLIFPLTFTSMDLLPEVKCARHALSIDDERSSFAPLLWDHMEDPRLKQVWFAGMHANVGGGYPDDSLASVPLAWMAREAQAAGLGFHPRALTEMQNRATPFGKMYDSRSGLASLYRYQPRQVCCQVGGKTVAAVPVVHESVVFRMATGFQGYAPIALPQAVSVVDKSGVVRQFGSFQTAAQTVRFTASTGAPSGAGGSNLAGMVALLQPPKPADLGLVKASVFHRRIAYFGTLLPLLALLAFPMLGPLLPQAAQTGQDWVQTLGEVGSFTASITPWYFMPWHRAVAHNPWTAAVLAIAVMVFFCLGRGLSTTIQDRARAAWHIGHNPTPAGPTTPLLDQLALDVMDSGWAKHGWTFTASKLFPAVAIVLALLFPVFLVDRIAFWLQSSSGGVCNSATKYEQLTRITDEWRTVPFEPSKPCAATGFAVRKDHRYQIQLLLDEKGEWRDADIKADLTGLDLTKVSYFRKILMYGGTPFRRHMDEAWFVPIARVGKYGSEEYPLKASDVREGSAPRWQMTSVITPAKNDELFLFLNDAYSGLFPLALLDEAARQKSGSWARHLYGNNRGTATIAIRREPAPTD